MSLDDQGLTARIRQVRRLAAARHRATNEDPGPRPDEAPGTRERDLADRVAHLEQLVEGLQDAVHRETERQGKLIAELQAQLDPAALRSALAEDARIRGL